jgi:hypothetical protein
MCEHDTWPLKAWGDVVSKYVKSGDRSSRQRIERTNTELIRMVFSRP